MSCVVRSGSRPSASASAEPDIKIVGTVPGTRHTPSPAHLHPHHQRPGAGGHPRDSDYYRKQRETEERHRAMSDPRHAAALAGAQAQLLSAAAHYHHGAPGSGQSLLPGHMMPGSSAASAAALLQYQQLVSAAALGMTSVSLISSTHHHVSAGIPNEALLKQQYPGLSGVPSHLLTAGAPHPATELLLERERQIAQERDRALR